MQALIKEVIALGKTDAKKLASLEPQLLGAATQLNRSEIVELVSHLGKQNIGSTELWRSLERATLVKWDEFTGQDVLDLTYGYLDTDFNPEPELQSRIEATLELLTDEHIMQEKREDPYYGAKMDELAKVAIAKSFGTIAVDNTATFEDFSKPANYGPITVSDADTPEGQGLNEPPKRQTLLGCPYLYRWWNGYEDKTHENIRSVAVVQFRDEEQKRSFFQLGEAEKELIKEFQKELGKHDKTQYKFDPIEALLRGAPDEQLQQGERVAGEKRVDFSERPRKVSSEEQEAELDRRLKEKMREQREEQAALNYKA